MAAPEYETQIQQPDVLQNITQIPEQMEQLPPQIQPSGVQPVPQHPTSLHDPATGQVVAQNMTLHPTAPIPDTPENIHAWTKGDPSESRTWAGVFYERVIAIAKTLGISLPVRNSSNA